MWLDLLRETYLGNFIIPLGNSGVWFAWKGFGRPDIELAAFVCTLTVCAAFMTSYWLGYAFSKNKEGMPITEEGFARFSRFLYKYGPYILAVQWIPFLSIFALLCGFSRIGWPRVLIPVLLGRAFYYYTYLT